MTVNNECRRNEPSKDFQSGYKRKRVSRNIEHSNAAEKVTHRICLSTKGTNVEYKADGNCHRPLTIKSSEKVRSY